MMTSVSDDSGRKTVDTASSVMLNIPSGFETLLNNFASEVLREQPSDILLFGAIYFNNLLEKNVNRYPSSTQNAIPTVSTIVDNHDKPNSTENVDIDLNDPALATAATQIQSAFRGFKSRQSQGNVNDIGTKDESISSSAVVEEAPKVKDEEVINVFDNEVIIPPKFKKRGRRGSVSAEAFDPDKVQKREKVFHHKTDEQRERIRCIICQNLLFRSLEASQMNEVLDAMFQKNVEIGDQVIVQGDDGDNFYVVESGKYDVIVNNNIVGQVSENGSFGELALMYNTPRAATIETVESGVLWAMDRNTFRHILLESTSHQRHMYEMFLESVAIMVSLEPYERVKVADALISKVYTDDEYIIHQNDQADSFYIVESGTVKVTVKREESDVEMFLKELSKGEYFSELALLTNNLRAASVRAVGTVKCACLDKQAFERILGPIQDIMKRNIEDYKKQLEALFESADKV